MLTFDGTFRRQKFMCLFSTATLKWNEWMNLVMCTPKGVHIRKRWCVHLKTPEHQGDHGAQHASTLCLSCRLHLIGTATAAHGAPKLLCFSQVFWLNFGSFKDVFCFFSAGYFSFAYLLLIYKIWKIYWITKAFKLLHRKKKQAVQTPSL